LKKEKNHPNQAVETAPAIRERYLAALVEIQTLLLSESSGEKIFRSIMQILGQAAEACRVHIHTNYRDEKGRWFSTLMGQWNAPGISPMGDDARFRTISYSVEFGRWFELLSRGMYITGNVADFPHKERAILRPLGVRTILILPIFVSGTFYGFIGFNNCVDEREWTTGEISLLQIAAAGISLAQQRQWDEEALRRSQSSLLLILDQLPAILWTTNRDLKVMSIRGSDRIGIKGDDLANVFDIFHTRTEYRNLTEVHRQALNGERVSLELFYENRVFQARLDPFYNAKGAIVGVLGLALDITDRKQVEADLRKSEVALRTLNTITLDQELSLFEKIQALLVMGVQHFEMDTGILAKIVNDDYEVIEFYSTGRTFAKGEHLNLSYTFSQEVLKSERPLAFEKATGTQWESHLCHRTYKIEAYMGATIRVAGKVYGTLSYSRLKAHDRPFSSAETEFLNLMAQWIGVELERDQYLRQMQDYAEEIARKNDALALARDQALESARLKSEFLATMSHEIRTPMNALIGMAELLHDTPMNKEQREYSEVIKNSSQDLLILINDILDFSKIEAGKLSLETIEFELASVVENTAELFAVRACQKKLGFMAFVSPGIPDVLRGDPVRLRQILSNLISNAIKFTDQGEVLIRVEPWRNDDHTISVKFEIQDTGIGLSDIARRRLFQPFTQADGSTSRKYGGTGLGLAISRRLVDLMRGEIGVESTEGIGSTFWFTAPFQLLDGMEARNRTGPLFNLAGYHILIADRMPSHREILRRYCVAWGMRCGEADTIESAIAQFSEAERYGDPYQAALVDFNLPEMNLAPFLKKVNACHLAVPVNLILLTRYDQRPFGKTALDAGFKAFLVKPVKRSQLFEKLGEVVTGMAEAPVLVGSSEGQPALSKEEAFTGQTDRIPAREPGLILLAEDNPANQKLGMAQIRKLGYRGELLPDGKLTVEAVLHNPERYLVVLMDTQMPEMDGLEATRIIRQAESVSGSHIPIIALTASALEEDFEACLKAGMNEVYTKPISLDQLRSAIEKWKKNSSLVTLPDKIDASFDAAPTLDASILAEIYSLQVEGEPDLLAELIDAFFKNSKKLMEQISTSESARDEDRLRRAAHSLKGSSGNLGATRLAEMCGEVERLAQLKELDAISPLLPFIEAEYQKVLSALLAEKNAAH
jgi:signal transduction histidine kinase/DNA-binding response OmpR family regulator/HPt (histidine-containing phosphotransfer) domain-containing protein/PAS domain-containing protein